jgi:hypothetical protein
MEKKNNPNQIHNGTYISAYSTCISLSREKQNIYINLNFLFYPLSMTASHELLRTEESFDAHHAISWPFSEHTLRSAPLKVNPSGSDTEPAITIQTPADKETTVRSPVNGNIEVIKQPDSTSTVVLLSEDDPRLIIIMGRLSDAIHFSSALVKNNTANPDLFTTVREGMPIGTLKTPHTKMSLQVAYQTEKPDSMMGWQLIDPRKILPPLRQS